MNFNIDYKTKLLKLFPGIQNIRFKLQGIFKEVFRFMRYIPGSSKHFGPPRGLYMDAGAFNLYNSKSHNLIKEVILAPETFCERTIPITNSKSVLKRFSKFTKARIIEKKGHVLYNARYLSGDGGTVITSDDKIFYPCSPLRNEWYPDKHQSLYKWKLPKPFQLEKVILIDTKCAGDNYGHWMMDHLSRLYWLSKMNLDLSDYTLVWISNNTKYQKYSYDMLERVGIRFKNELQIKQQHFSCVELVVPPYSTIDLNQEGSSRDIEEISFLRKIFLSNSRENNLTAVSKIYVSRRKSIRTFEGEMELFNRLESFGFKEVFLEDHTISEQAELFKNADIVIGLHGSGFTNVCFCHSGTNVVEIFGPNFIVVDFWSISNLVNANYFAYCEDKYKQNINLYRVARNEPVMIDIDNFFAFLKEHRLIS